MTDIPAIRALMKTMTAPEPWLTHLAQLCDEVERLTRERDEAALRPTIANNLARTELAERHHAAAIRGQP